MGKFIDDMYVYEHVQSPSMWLETTAVLVPVRNGWSSSIMVFEVTVHGIAPEV